MSAQGTPSYRLHKATGRAVVTLNGRDHYLGEYGTPASRRAYDRLMAEWLTRGRLLPSGGTQDLTVAELVNLFRKHVQAYYRKNGRPTGEEHNFRSALRPLLKIYADLPAKDFSPLKLKTVREAMITQRWSRKFLNRQVGRIRMMFAWGVENELVPPDVYHGLQAVKGIKAGRNPDVRETGPVRPVPDVYVDAIKPYVSAQVWAMIELQRLTGMRPGEVVSMTPADIDTTGETWEYRPQSHKNEHHNRERIVPLGPRAKKIVQEFWKPDFTAPLFCPREAEKQRHARAKTHRRADQKPNKKRSKRVVRNAYDSHSYRRAIARGCQKADRQARLERPDTPWDQAIIPTWHPHQLRHNYATQVRKRFGLEVARAALGHASAAVTELYAEVDLSKAAAVAAELG